jgi:predicted RNase H-like nuclease (RuvC/YqgF family)
MGKQKQKNHRPDEFLKEQVRHLRKEIKRKDQKIRQLEKELGYSFSKTEKEAKKQQQDENLCKECGKGEISLMDIGVRLYAICKLCHKRDRIS